MSDLVVRPVRFTDNVQQMREFLEAVGLRPRVESETGGWVDMVAGGGMLALHSARDSVRQAPSGLTTLSFEADDVDVVADRLRKAEVPDVVVYDEAYGRVLGCRDPLGDEIAVDERSDDPYGYRVHQPDGLYPGLRVMPVVFTDPLGSYSGFLEALGLQRRGAPDTHFTLYAMSEGRHGLVGLHPVPEDRGVLLAEAGVVHLSFETSEPLDAIAGRLTDAGFAPSIRTEPFGDVLSVDDADGQHVEIHASGEDAG
jgi:hypothetical protein